MIGVGLMHPEDIKAAIRKRGETISSLAARHGMKAQSLSRAIHERSSAKAENIIADFLGLRPCDVWPHRYDRRGRRLSLIEIGIAA